MKHLHFLLWLVILFCGCYNVANTADDSTDAGLVERETSLSRDVDSDSGGDTDGRDTEGDLDTDVDTDGDGNRIPDIDTDEDEVHEGGRDTELYPVPDTDAGACAEMMFDISGGPDRSARCVFEVDSTVINDPDKVNVECDEEIIPLDEDCSLGVGWSWVDDKAARFQLCGEPCERLRLGEFDWITVEQGCHFLPTVK